MYYLCYKVYREKRQKEVKVWFKKFLWAATREQPNTRVGAFFSPLGLECQAEVYFSSYRRADPRRLAFSLASNRPYHPRKRQQRWEFNERSNCCGSPALCCGGVMNDSLNAPCCEEIAAACCYLNPLVVAATSPRDYLAVRERGFISKEPFSSLTFSLLFYFCPSGLTRRGQYLFTLSKYLQTQEYFCLAWPPNPSDTNLIGFKVCGFILSLFKAVNTHEDQSKWSWLRKDCQFNLLQKSPWKHKN